MVEIIFTQSVAGVKNGVRFSYGSGKVVSMDKEDAKKWIEGKRALLYDEYVEEVKEKARGTLKPIKRKIEKAVKKRRVTKAIKED